MNLMNLPDPIHKSNNVNNIHIPFSSRFKRLLRTLRLKTIKFISILFLNNCLKLL